MPTVLIIEDERIMRTGLRDTLRDAGFTAHTAAEGETGLRMALENPPDLLLLDVMMPKLDGFSVCRALRRRGQWFPVILLTAKGMVEDRVTGLDAGADDYLIKPFSAAELLARVRALLRGREHARHHTPDLLEFGGIQVDFTSHRCTRDGAPVDMTAREFAVLQLLAARRGQTVSRHQFLNLVWGLVPGTGTRTVDNHIAMLRSKLEPVPSAPRWITTVHRVGYRLEGE